MAVSRMNQTGGRPMVMTEMESAVLLAKSNLNEVGNRHEVEAVLALMLTMPSQIPVL